MRNLMLLGFLLVHLSNGLSQETQKLASKPILASLNFEPDYNCSINIPFRLNGGLILVGAQHKGQKGTYIFDTGSPSLIINSKNNSRAKSQVKKFVGITGDIDIQKRTIRNFCFGRSNYKKLKALHTDISHIEKHKDTRIKGLLGQFFIKDYETLIDYQKKEITIFEANQNSNFHQTQKPVDIIPFIMDEHIPVIMLNIGGADYYFGLDSGAEVNVIDPKIAHLLEPHFSKHRQTKNLLGIGNERKEVIFTQIKSLEINNREYKDMDVIISDIVLFNQNNKVKLDGLLGYPFLSSGKFSINYKKKSLYVWESYVDPVVEGLSLK